MAPTRELCMQIGKDARKFCKPLGLRVVCVYGGTGISEQIAELKVSCLIYLTLSYRYGIIYVMPYSYTRLCRTAAAELYPEV